MASPTVFGLLGVAANSLQGARDLRCSARNDLAFESMVCGSVIFVVCGSVIFESCGSVLSKESRLDDSSSAAVLFSLAFGSFCSLPTLIPKNELIPGWQLPTEATLSARQHKLSHTHTRTHARTHKGQKKEG